MEYKVSVLEYLLAPYKNMARKKAVVLAAVEPVALTFKQKAIALWNKHAWSVFTTFLATFLASTIPLIDTLGKADVERAVVVGVLVAGVRAGVKAVIEAVIKNKF